MACSKCCCFQNIAVCEEIFGWDARKGGGGGEQGTWGLFNGMVDK